MAVMELWRRRDLEGAVKTEYIDGNFFTQDSVGNLVGVRVYSNGAEVALTGSVTGYCILPSGETVSVAGTRSGNQASILVPQSALAYTGPLGITIKLVDGNTITTLMSIIVVVYRSKTDNVITPSSQIITDWANQISAALQEVEDASAAQDAKIADLKSALINHNSINVLEQITKNQSSTSYNGTTYTITDGVWAVSGTTSANFTRKIFESLSVLPEWFTPGKTIYIRLNKNGSMDSMRLVIYPAYNGAVDSNPLVDTRVDTTYTVPSDYTGSGLVVRLYASKNVTLNGTVFPEFLQALGNGELLEEIINVNAETIKFVSDPATVYAGKTLAEVDDNARFTALRSTFSDIPYPGQCLTFQVSSGYNVQLLVRNSTGALFTRIVARSDHSIYRDWAQHALLSDINNLTRFEGKKIYCDGDSIMVGVITTSPEYPSRTVANPNIPDAISTRIQNATVDNKAHGGDYIRSMNDASVSICDSILADSTVSGYDYFVINGGTNDYTNDSGSNPTTLGTIDSSDTATFYGAYNAIMQYIFSQNPKARVMLITPCFRNYMHSTRGNAYEIQNNQGITLGDFCDAVINIGKKYAVPVYDSRTLGPVNAWNYQTLLVPRTETGTDAHIHPSQDGYTLYGDAIASFFLSNF